VKDSRKDRETTLNALAFTVFSLAPGSRTRDNPGAEEAYDLTKENSEK
jgi:hypothetical protein